MGLRKEILLTVKDYTIKLDKEIKFYENDTIDLCFSILEYGIEVKDEVVVNKLMPINTLSAYMCIETPQGVDYAEATEIEGNRVIFKLGSKYSQFIGVGRMQIVIRDSDGCRITLPEFPFEIRKSIYDNKGDEGLEYLSTELNEAIVDEYGNPIKMVKISELEEATTLPTNSYTMIIDGSSNKKIKTDLLSSGDNYDDTEIRLAIDNKVDKIDGHSLVADAEIARLASVNNYDDTEIKEYTKQYVDDEIINRLGDLELVTLTQEEYDSLEVKEDNVLYFIETDGDVESSKYVKEDEYTAFKNSANSRLDKVESDIISVNSQLEEVFQSVSNGKLLIAEAITDKGVQTSATDTFQTMAENISNIESGGSAPQINTEKRYLEGQAIICTHTIGTNITNTNLTSVSPSGVLGADGKYHLRYRVENGIQQVDSRYDKTDYDFEIPYPLVGDGTTNNEIRQKSDKTFEYVRRCTSGSEPNYCFEVPPLTPDEFMGRNNNYAYVDNKLYLVGAVISATRTEKCYVYDFISGAWSRIADYPMPICENGICYYNGKIYSFGGYYSSYITDIYVYDIATNVWSKALLNTTIDTSSNCSCIAHNDVIYITNFTTSTYTNYIHCYNITTGVVEKSTSCSKGLCRCNPVIYNDKIYCLSYTTGTTNDICIYDIPSKSWSFVTTPQDINLYRASVSLLGDKIYYLGGGYSKKTTNFIVYDITNGTFEKLTNCNTISRSSYSFHRDNKLYVIGGYSNRLNDPDSQYSELPYCLGWRIYDFNKEYWYDIPPFGEEKYANCVLPYNDDLFVLGYSTSSLLKRKIDSGIAELISLTSASGSNVDNTMTPSAIYGDKIYISSYSHSYLRVYDITNNTWNKIDMPFYGLNRGTMDIHNGIIYMNGELTEGSSPYECMYMYDIATGTQTYIKHKNLMRNFMTSTVYGDKIYYFGGSDTVYTYEFDISTQTFKRLADIPIPISEACCCAYNGNIYLIGGYNANGANKKIYIYNIQNDSWSQSIDLPSVVNGCCCIVGEYCYIFAGSCSPNVNMKYYCNSNIYRLKISDLQTVTEEIIPLSQDFNMITKKHITNIISLQNPAPTISCELDVEIP